MPKRAGKSQLKTISRGMGKANNSLKSITSVIEQIPTALQQIQESAQGSSSGGGQSDAKILMSLKIQQAQLEIQKDQAAFLKKISDGQNKQIEALQKGNKDWKTVGDKFKDMRRNLSNALDPNTIKKAMLGPFSMFKGVRNKIEDLDFSKRMKAQGDTRTNKQLREESKKQRGNNLTALRAQDEIDWIKKSGASEEDIKKNRPDLFNKRNKALKAAQESNIVNPDKKKGFTGDQPSAKPGPDDANNKMGGNVAAKSTPLAQLPSDKGKVAQSTTDLLAEQQVKRENDAEMLRLTGGQMDFLQQIANNTAIMAGTAGSSAGGGEDSGRAAKPKGGISKLASGISDTMGALGSGVSAIGKGIGDGIGAIFKGILGGLSDGIKTFASAKTVAGIAVMGLLTAVVYGMSEALQKFSKIEWKTLAKAALTLTGLIFAAESAGASAPLLGLGALALAGLGAAVWVIGEAMNAMGDGLKNFTDGLERLSQIDGGNLISVAAGVAALGAAIAAFGVGQAVGGLGNLVGGFLGAVTPGGSPVDQLIKIGTVGPGVKDAADGMERMSGAMAAFSKVDPKSMQSVKDFPWEQATKFAAAGGSMSVGGASVYNASKGNADEQAKVDGKKGGGAVVNAPTSNVSTSSQTNVIKPQVRNTESSYNKYLMTRFA